MSDKKKVEMYSDGSCFPNPGGGGLAVLLRYNGHEKTLVQKFRLTTNNRMEMLSVIVGLETLTEPCKIQVVSDSQYVVHSFNKGWLESWRKRNWRKSDGKKVLNIDLWKRFIPLIEKHDVTFQWIKGHADHTENNICDILANSTLKRTDIPTLIDTEYEKLVTNKANLWAIGK